MHCLRRGWALARGCQGWGPLARRAAVTSTEAHTDPSAGCEALGLATWLRTPHPHAPAPAPQAAAR